MEVQCTGVHTYGVPFCIRSDKGLVYVQIADQRGSTAWLLGRITTIKR